MNFDHPSLDRMVASLQEQSDQYFSGRSVREIVVEQTIPRPYSQLARILIRFTDGHESAFIKLYRHPRLGSDFDTSSATREFEAHAELHKTFEGVEGYGVVRPIALFPELGGWVMEAVEGQTLDQVLSRKGNRWASHSSKEELQDLLQKAGAWLRHLHQNLRREESISLSSTGVLDEIDKLIDRVRSLQTGLFDRVRTHVGELARRQGDRALAVVGQHGECFAPHHIFVRDQELLVFDITGIKYGSEYEDLSNLWIGLEALLKYPLFSRSDVQTLQSSFLRGFSETQQIQSEAFEIFRIKNMLQLSDSLNRISATDWRSGARKTIGLRFIRRWFDDRV